MGLVAFPVTEIAQHLGPGLLNNRLPYQKNFNPISIAILLQLEERLPIIFKYKPRGKKGPFLKLCFTWSSGTRTDEVRAPRWTQDMTSISIIRGTACSGQGVQCSLLCINIHWDTPPHGVQHETLRTSLLFPEAAPSSITWISSLICPSLSILSRLYSYSKYLF